jgi:ATP-dependent exoDNAse (exonuclease V) alpha subunit
MKPLPSDLLEKRFPHEPTAGQLRFFALMDHFLLEDSSLYQAFMLKGYAGTGKTTLVSTIIKVLKDFGYRTVLLAPTGRAAKVMSQYTRKNAQTIHKKIYRQVANPHTGNLEFKRQPNYHQKTVFIIDESSMISDDPDFGTRGLLTDLFEYVFTTDDEGQDTGNRLMFIGDTAQLPPVHKSISPALDANYLQSSFHVGVLEHELTEVMRQDANSGILLNATNLRDSLRNAQEDVLIPIKFITKGHRDFYRMTSDRLEEGLQYAYRKFGRENTIVLTRSNKTAVQYNRYIRQRIFDQDEELNTGDLLMIVRNNYFWLDEETEAGFLANGDFVEVRKIRKVEELYGFRFATLVLRLTDYAEQEEFEAKIILNTLYSNSASLSQEENRNLYEAIQEDYMHIVSKRDRNEAMRKDPYLNALQVKFAYALTCHKSQGGQWNAVFVEQGYLTEDQINSEYVRWLYTAITRASDELFLVNFNQQFF